VTRNLNLRTIVAGLALLGGSIAGGQGAVMLPASAAPSHHVAPAFTIHPDNPCFPDDSGYCHLTQFTGATSWGAVAPRGPASATPDLLNCMFGYGSLTLCKLAGIHVPTDPETGQVGWHNIEWKSASTAVWDGKTAKQFSVGAFDQRYANVVAYVRCSYNPGQHSYALATILAGPTVHGRRESTTIAFGCTANNGQRQATKEIDVSQILVKMLPEGTWFSRDWHCTIKINWAGGKVSPDVSLWNLSGPGGTFDPDPGVVHNHH
jgi:hypothetical protein